MHKRLEGIIHFISLHSPIARVAQLVEHHLAKVRVAGSSLVSRSTKIKVMVIAITFFLETFPLKGPDGGIGRHAGLKILYPLKMCGFKSRSGYESFGLPKLFCF